MTFIPSPFSPESSGHPVDDQHRRYNFDICRAIDMTKLGIVLDKMVEDGWMDSGMAKIYETQASALLAAIRAENNRCHGSFKAKD